MTAKRGQAQRVVVAHVGDREFTVPARFDFFTTGATDERFPWEVTVTVEVVDGRPMYRAIHLTAHEPMSPLEVQRLPWGRLAEGALEDRARSVGDREPRAVRAQRERSRARSRKEPPTDRRRPVDRERLAGLLELRQEAQAQGVRWDTYAAKALGYTPAYVRRLYTKAKQEGLTDGEH